jgi:hypothetical protein
MSDNKLTVGTLIKDKLYPEVGIIVDTRCANDANALESYKVFVPGCHTAKGWHSGKAMWFGKRYIEMECVVIKAGKQKRSKREGKGKREKR